MFWLLGGKSQIDAQPPDGSQGRVRHIGIGGRNGVLNIAADLASNGPNQRIFILEMIVKTALSNASGLNNIVDCHGIDRPYGKQPAPSRDKRLPRAR